MQKTTIPIKGMHCKSCELLIEDELKSVNCVCQASASHTQAHVHIWHEGELNHTDVATAIQRAGYEVGETTPKPWFNPDIYPYLETLLILAIVLIFAWMLDWSALKNLTNSVSGHPSSLLVVLLIGLTAGFSTCMALVGGLVLGVASRFAAKHPTASPMEKFKPHLLFNLGRIGGYLVFGAVIGAVGSVFQLSGYGLGAITVLVSGVMILLGLQLTGLFPRLETLKLTLPKALAGRLGIKTSSEGYSHVNAVVSGALTFFLPCGFTQAMQLYAMTTGSPVKAALIMGIFAVGTAPGLLGIGGLTAIIKGAFAQSFFRFAGVIVIILGFFNLTNGLNLFGINLSRPALVSAGNQVQIKNGIQEVQMVQDRAGYSPNRFTIKVGVPVRWVITSKNVNTCASSIVLPKLGISRNLHPGENVIEFTPTEAGTLPFSCSMGMYVGEFIVERDGETGALPSSPQKAASCNAGGCGCGMGGVAFKPQATPQIPTVQANKVQVLKTVFSQGVDIQPNSFTAKANQPVRFEVEARDDGFGCMAAIMIPGLVNEPRRLTQGETLQFEFTPDKKGEYLITCAMGVPRGVINVI